jgi:hypothetical protein
MDVAGKCIKCLKVLSTSGAAAASAATITSLHGTGGFAKAKVAANGTSAWVVVIGIQSLRPAAP